MEVAPLDRVWSQWCTSMTARVLRLQEEFSYLLLTVRDPLEASGALPPTL
jgi:hypothetical protein